MATRDLTGAGLTVKTLDEVRTDLQDAIHGSAEFGEEARVGPDSALGQIIDSMAEEIVDLDDMAQAVYDSFDPDSAEGTELDNVCSLTGCTRKDATYSTVILTITGTPATVIPAGTRYRVDDGPIFATDAEATVAGGGTVDVDATCTVTGPSEAAAGSVTVIVDAISGITAVTNAADAILGTDTESDIDLRVRRVNDIGLPGSGTDQAIRAALEEITEVQSASVISNREPVVDANGIPGNNFRAILWPATSMPEEEIAETIWDHMSTGIRPDGAEEYVITDDQGYAQTIRWSYAAEQELYLEANITTAAGYPATGDDLVKAALLAYGNSLRPGDDVRPDRFEAICQLGYAPLEIEEIPGIDEITVLAKIGGAPGPGDTGRITIELTQIARFDTTRITVNS